jgi:hypothetical protein
MAAAGGNGGGAGRAMLREPSTARENKAWGPHIDANLNVRRERAQ